MASKLDWSYSLKLVSPEHIRFGVFNGAGGYAHKGWLMNFKSELDARKLPAGARSLVYVTEPVGKVAWAIRYCGSVEEGAKLATEYKVGRDPKWKFFRPMRFLARVDHKRALDTDEIKRATGIDIRSYGSGLKTLGQRQYDSIVKCIPW